MPVNTAAAKNVVPLQLTLPNHYLRQLLGLLKSRGVDTQALLVQAGVAEHLIGQADATVSWQQFHRLVKLSVTQSEEPALGLYLGSQLTITTHGLLGLVALSSEHLQQALQLICRYISTRSPLISLQLKQTAQHTTLVLTERYPLADISAFMAETVMVALHQVLQVLSEQHYQPLSLHFAYSAPAYQTLYQAFFPCQVYFDQPEHSICFANTCLAISPPFADSVLQQQLSSQCEHELQRQQRQTSISAAILMLLGRAKGRIPDISQVATEFNLSERTLRRRLNAECSSYQQLVVHWRQQMAQHYLTHTTLQVQQIAYLLGYADPANFGRAFRQQCNISPRQFRQRYALTQ